jgi:hypothetical protein
MKYEKIKQYSPEAAAYLQERGFRVKKMTDKKGYQYYTVLDNQGNTVQNLVLPERARPNRYVLSSERIADQHQRGNIRQRMLEKGVKDFFGIFTRRARGNRITLANKRKNKGDFRAFFQDYKRIINNLARSGEINYMSFDQIGRIIGLPAGSNTEEAIKALNILAQGGNDKNKDLFNKVKDIVSRAMTGEGHDWYKDIPSRYLSLESRGGYSPTWEGYSQLHNQYLSGQISKEEFLEKIDAQRQAGADAGGARQYNVANKKAGPSLVSSFVSGLQGLKDQQEHPEIYQAGLSKKEEADRKAAEAKKKEEDIRIAREQMPPPSQDPFAEGVSQNPYKDEAPKAPPRRPRRANIPKANMPAPEANMPAPEANIPPPVTSEPESPLHKLKRPEPPTSNDLKDWEAYIQNIETYKQAVNDIIDPEARKRKEAESAASFNKAFYKEPQQVAAEEAFAANLKEIQKLTRHAKEKLFITEEKEKRAKRHKNLNANDFFKMFRIANTNTPPEHGSYGGIAQALALANKAIPPTTWRG